MNEPDPITRLNAALEGRYHIEREIGEGGMATVYLADDLRHERKVALKVLKPELAAVVGADRFLAEIKTTANLQHPHILPLFDSGEADRFLFYVMPFVEGESLRERLDRERQLPVDEAVQIAKDVAEALQAAHDMGVIHRDVKPANILLSKGRPLVSDFGIALALGAAGAGRLTETGLSLGTPHYMSPEQATGDLSVGAGSDIYALGCVLYEMLVGEPPFTGGTPQAVLGKIVTGAADQVRQHRHAVPVNVNGVVRKALEKVPADRFISAKDFALALADPRFVYGESVRAGASDRNTWRNIAFALAVLLAVSAATAAWLALKPTESRPVARFELTLPLGVSYSNGVAISPDEETIAFAALDGVLYVRRLDEPDMVAVPDAVGAFNPFFSPDGEWIGYIDTRDQTLKKVRTAGGGTQTVAEFPGGGRSAVWLSDGTIIASSNQLTGLHRVSNAGGEWEPVPNTGESFLRDLSLLPNEEAVLAYQGEIGGQHELVAVRLDTGEQITIGPGSSPAYVPDSRLVYWNDGSLWAGDFDVDELALTGDAVPVVQDVFAGAGNGFAFYAVGRTTLLYEEGTENVAQPMWVARNGSTQMLNPRLRGTFVSAAVSPAGDMIAYEHVPVGGSRDIWIYDLNQGTLARLTVDGANNRYPFWSPDGTEVGYSSGRDSLAALYSRPVDLSEEAHLLLADSTESLYEAGWTPDGELLVYRRGSTLTRGQFDIWYADPDVKGSAASLLDSPAAELKPALSPDGHWLAYVSDESGQREVYVRPFPGSGGRVQISTDGGESPAWARSGRELFYLTGLTPRFLMVASVRTSGGFSVERRSELIDWTDFGVNVNHPPWDVAADDQRFITTGFPEDTPGRYVLVQNFDLELDRLLPAN